MREHLDNLLESAFTSISIPDEPASLYDPVRYTMDFGGKRFRPRLVLLTAGLCGGELEEALPVALAVEMLHNFTLIHDDIMDNANTRRGKPSVHKKWDKPTAILSGDVLFALAMKQLNEYGNGEPEFLQTRARLMSRFLDVIQTVCDGQALDMEFQSRDDVTTEEYLAMIRAKTAALIRCSMEMGAIVAGADDQMLRKCADIGNHTGLAFQIQDDLLDAVGDSGKFGKKVGGDIIEGKKTYLSILALERADDTDRNVLKQILGNSKTGESEILRVIRIYHDLGVIDSAAKAVTRHYQSARQQLELFEESDFRNEINVLLDKLKVRDN